MAEENENTVTLHGMWASLYTKRIELALRMKGIEYDYVEEDLTNKSPLLLQHNPVYKKVPVLVHGGKPIMESLLILEYIDERWKRDGPLLLPEDPDERARVRFWANFLQHQLLDSIHTAVLSEGEAQERAIAQVHEKLMLLEEGIGGGFPGGFPCINCQKLGFLDIVVSSMVAACEVYEEVLGVNFVDSEKYPLMSSWMKSLAELALVKELSPPHDKNVNRVRAFREKVLQSQST